MNGQDEQAAGNYESYPSPAPYMLPQQQRDNDFYQRLIDSEPEIRTFRLALEGKDVVEDENGVEHIKEVPGARMLNEKGVHFVMTQLKAIFTQNTFVSNIKEERMYDVCLYTQQTFATALWLGWVSGEYAVKNAGIYDTICESFNNLCEFAVRRPINEGERNAFRSNMIRTESKTVMNTQNQGGGFQLPKLWG